MPREKIIKYSAEKKEERVRLYRKRNDGTLKTLLIQSSDFLEYRDFQSAIDQYYNLGYCESRKEAMDS